MDERIDLPQGTLDLLILKTPALEPQHGWEVELCCGTGAGHGLGATSC